MSLVQRILYAIRTLTEDESNHSKRKRARHRNRNNSRHQQAVALVITFRDLFATGGLNYLLDDAESNPKSCKRRTRDNKEVNKAPEAISPILLHVKEDFTSDLTLPMNLKMAPAEAWYIDRSQSPESVPLLHEERIISTSEIALLNSSVSSSSVVPVVESTSREVDVPREWDKRKDIVVSLTVDDEKKTAAILRKVLKWSPRKQSTATFALEVPTDEKQKAVAVVENAVNRVKEEQQQKKKRKLKLFKLTFC